MTYLWVAIGSAIGGVGRYWCGALVSARWSDDFPWGTILVNVAGSFVIGVVGAMGETLDRSWLPGHHVRAFIVVGFCGGYTTFSAFSLQTLDLLREGACKPSSSPPRSRPLYLRSSPCRPFFSRR